MVGYFARPLNSTPTGLGKRRKSEKSENAEK
jgi:hypothetical protein